MLCFYFLSRLQVFFFFSPPLVMYFKSETIFFLKRKTCIRKHMFYIEAIYCRFSVKKFKKGKRRMNYFCKIFFLLERIFTWSFFKSNVFPYFYLLFHLKIEKFYRFLFLRLLQFMCDIKRHFFMRYYSFSYNKFLYFDFVFFYY